MMRQHFNSDKIKHLPKPNINGLKKLKVKKRFIFFGQTSGIHGLRHLFATGAFFIIRLFWLLILLTSAWCLYLLLSSDGGDDLNFTPDTLYLTWTTTFPAVTVCESYNARASQRKLNEKYPSFSQSLSLEYKKYISANMYGRGGYGKTYCVPCGDRVPCDLPFREMADNIRLNCTALLSNCSFNGIEFPCCDKFLQVDSEYGPCYSLNTLQSENSSVDGLYTVNVTTGPGKLDFRLGADSEVAVHSPEELATLELDPKFKFDVKLYMENRVEYYFSIVGIENDKVLTREDLDVRRCRYYKEVPKDDFYVYPVYGFGACKLAHETELIYEHCKCVHPIRHTAYAKQYCNYTGINCIVIRELAADAIIMVVTELLVPVEKTKLGVDSVSTVPDQCLPSCEENELTTIHISRRWLTTEPGDGGASVTVQMMALPSLRFQRNLISSKLDIVVNIGGMFSLFFGASIFSLVEIVYLIFRKQ